MATLVATLDAVADLVDTLVPEVLEVVHREPQDQMYEFPCAEVRFGAGTISRNLEGRVLERQRIPTGSVRIFVARQQELPGNAAQFAPIVDAIVDLFRANPRLEGVADRFDATGYTGLLYDESSNLLFLDVNWSATDAEPDSFVQDW